MCIRDSMTTAWSPPPLRLPEVPVTSVPEAKLDLATNMHLRLRQNGTGCNAIPRSPQRPVSLRRNPL
eukprot:240597-Lingulodinium_polyedra.AAC.1